MHSFLCNYLINKVFTFFLEGLSRLDNAKCHLWCVIFVTTAIFGSRDGAYVQ